MKARSRHCGRLVLCLLAWLAGSGCGPVGEAPLLDPDPGLLGLALVGVGPSVLLPTSQLLLLGKDFPTPGDGSISVRLRGTAKGEQVAEKSYDVRLRAEYVSQTTARVPNLSGLLRALGTTEGQLSGQATVIVESAIDLTTHTSAPIEISLTLQRVLVPTLSMVQPAKPSGLGADRVHTNDWFLVQGSSLLLNEEEGQTVAVLDGCFLPEGTTGSCAQLGVPVRGVELPIKPVMPLDRRVGVFAYGPTVHGVRPGKFLGTVSLKNVHRTPSAISRSESRPLSLTQVVPELVGIAPDAVSLGQYAEIKGAGLVPTQQGQASLLRLTGQFMLDGSPIMIPVDLELVARWNARYPSDSVGSYVLDETDALGQALESRGGLRKTSGRFTGTAALVVRYQQQTVVSKSVPLTLRLLPVKQLVLVRFLPSYQESLRLFGLRAVDRAVRARVLSVAQRDYRGIHIEFREQAPTDPLPTDFAQYSVVEIGGSDPNGLGYLGYDNTPGRDLENRRLYDRIGGVNAVTQSDGSPGYGGVFAEQLLGFSGHPGKVEAIKVSATDSDLFDLIFDAVRPDVGGVTATPAEALGLPALTSGAVCPVVKTDRPRAIACAIFVLGSLLGTTMTHELGHSLGLANPKNPSGSYHNNGNVAGRIMNPGGLRSFRERAELSPLGPSVFCDTDFEYLRKILRPLDGSSDPTSGSTRPPCLE